MHLSNILPYSFTPERYKKSVHLITNNSTYKPVRTYLNRNHEHRIDISLLAGSIAGAAAASITTPLDLLKTRLQIQNLKPCPVLKESTTSSTVDSINSNNTRLTKSNYQYS
jgi:Mitochondrial carrier protein